MNLIDLLLLVLATQRVLNIWFAEPIASTPRAWSQRLPGWLSYLFACPYCLSVWVTASLLALLMWGGLAGWFIVAALAASSAALAWQAGFVIITQASVTRRGAGS